VKLKVPLVLASASPRRRHLLSQLGLGFSVHPSPVDESYPFHLPPPRAVQEAALGKARAVAERHSDSLTLGADTVVVLDEVVLGKPTDSQDAIAMLGQLSGRWHEVHTGIALMHPASGRCFTAAEQTRVRFVSLTRAEIESYVRSGSPLDKAGSYGIQDDFGSVYVSRIEGDFYTVMRLPLRRLYRLLQSEFLDLMDTVGPN
jgi:septum formation protein